MAPEMIEGEEYGKFIDIYSFGVTLYYACTGSDQFKGRNISYYSRER